LGETSLSGQQKRDVRKNKRLNSFFVQIVIYEQESKRQLAAWQESGDRWTASSDEWRRVQSELERERDEYRQMAALRQNKTLSGHLQVMNCISKTTPVLV